MGELEGKVAMVTGASRGIGRAIAIQLAQAGADLVVVSSGANGADGTCREVTALKRRGISLACDVSKPEEVEQLVGDALKAFGQVDVLVNNAGIVHRGDLAHTSDSEFERVLAVNLLGAFYLIRRIVPQMLKRKYGRVVNVSSISGAVGSPRLSAYCASKWGLNGLTKALAAELDGTGVMIAGVLPGSVDTQMLQGSGFEPKMTAEDVAAVVRYLCADSPAAMNGSLVEVYG
jgi:3-oxoacyl-[acyl-carrier protein] reductase